MFCKYCGNKIDEDYKFCSSCGKGLNTSAGEVKQINEPNEKETQFINQEINRHYLTNILNTKSERRQRSGYVSTIVGLILCIFAWVELSNTNSLSDNSSVFYTLFLIFGVFFFIFGLVRTIKAKTDPKNQKHYINKIINSTKYGNMQNLSEDFIKSRDAGVVKMGIYNATNKFLFRDSAFYFEIYPLSQLFWIYKSVTKHSINFIPTGKTYAAVLRFNSLKPITISASEETVHSYLLFLQSYCPWAKFGYDKNYLK